MSTPCYKAMKQRGTSFYAFPSSSSDINLANYNDFYDLNFTKFALLNIPRQVNGQPNPIDGIMDFLPKSTDGNAPFYCDDPNYTTPTKLSDQLVESLRNYVANYDTSLHESRINGNADFYNIGERYTPTEMIFFKWLRKLNLIDFEPAVHKVDWDKNLSDFDNKNNSTVTNTDYFRKYLWKEREIVDYKVESVYEDSTYTGPTDSWNTPLLIINSIAKFKIGDKIILKSSDSNDNAFISETTMVLGQSYTIGNIEFTTGSTMIWIDLNFQDQGGTSLIATYVDLDYNKLIQYVGEINHITNIQTATRVGQEVTAYIPHQAGKTPTILFGIRDNTNYYPNLEIPILADEIQREIVGTESLNSPMRTDPQNYPGSYFGQFDTVDYTYMCSNGDSVRYQGDYYGTMLTDNTGLNADNYVEKLTDFNSDSIDGVFLDVNKNHYYKMNIPGLETKNFDEFSSLSIEGQAPADFDFNAILWYYELIEVDSNNNVNSYVNLYGIEFLNNPENDDDSYSNLITPYHKLVTNGVHDGLSYMFNLNLHYNIDNDVQPLTYDPTTIYNMFGFDMYNEMMKRFYQVNENFVNIIQEFVRINMDLQDMKSLIYSQTDIDDLKSRMSNMEELLKLYATNQFIDSDSARISVDYSGVYPKLKFNVIGVEYDDIKNLSLTDVYNFNQSNTGASYTVTLSYSSKMLLNLINDNISNNNFGPVVLTFDNDLKNKQRLDIVIKPQYAQYAQNLTVNMMFTSGVTKIEMPIFSINLPKDLITYNILVPESSVFDDSFYLNDNIYVNCIGMNTGSSWCSTGYTELTLTEDMFKTGNTVYVQNLYLIDTIGNTVDWSGSYNIICKSGNTIKIDLSIHDIRGYILRGVPRVSYYRGLQVSILRVNGSDNSSFNQRYDVTYKII